MLATLFGLNVAEVEPSSLALGYRLSSTRVALHVKSKLVLGSFARGSHAPAPMPDCLVDHPRLAQAFFVVEREAQFNGITAYDERTGEGDLRYVWAKTNGEQVIITLVVSAAESRAAELLPDLLKICDGVLVSVQSGKSNSLRGDEARLMLGNSEVLESASLADGRGRRAGVHAAKSRGRGARLLGAGQPERGRLEPLAFDLYAGAGITTRALAQHYGEVVACVVPRERSAAGHRAEQRRGLPRARAPAHLPRVPD